MQPVADKRAAAARAFVRSLNILLKFAKMYDFGHPRTARQYETAWAELRTAIGDGDAGLLLAVSGDQLLVDGSPLEAAAAEKSFARMLSSAGIASIYFGAKVNQASLAKFVRAFPTGTSSKPAQLAEQLKSALQGDPNIHVNEVCFVPADSAVAKTTVAAQLAARTLGLTSEQQDEMLNDPEKLLKLIVAAEGMKSGNGVGSGPGEGPGLGPGDGSGSSGGTGIGSGSGSRPGFGTGTGSGADYQSPYNGSPAEIEPSARSDNPWRIGRWGRGSDPKSSAGVSSGTSGSGSIGGAARVVPGASGGEKSSGEQTLRGGSAITQNSSGTAGWNIVGSGDETGLRTEIDANAGGFWLKDSFARASANRSTGGSPTAENAVLAGLAAAIARTTGADSQDAGSAAGFDGAAGPSGASAGGGTTTPGGSRSAGQPSGFGSPSRWATATSSLRTSRAGRKQHSSMTLETGLMSLSEDELQGILQMLAQIARTSGEGQIDPSAFQSRLSQLSRRARFTVSQALSALAAQAPSAAADKSTLLKLAEHIAVRFAIENYERGDIKVDAVQQLLGEMNQEIDALRKVVGAYEEKMVEAGIQVPAHQDALAEQFWAQIPDEKKRAVLNSDDAWCVPPGRIREFIEGLRAKGESDTADQVLSRYLTCITNRSVDVRRQVSMGLAELAVVYAGNEKLLTEAIRQTGVQLAEETEAELQSLVSAAFVRLSQEAVRKRSFSGLQRSIELVGYIEGERPNIGQSLHPRIGVESRLPEFVDEALRSGEMPPGLRDLLRRMPDPASEQIASRFSRSGLREDCDLLLSMIEALGPEALEHLRTVLREGPTSEAINTIGVLARLDPETLVQFLPVRMRDWKRTAHDRVVRQIAGSGSAERGRLLLEIFDEMDELIRPLAVDEIGMTGEQTANMRLLRLAEEPVAKGQSGYLRLKAIEALGRLRTMAAEATLRKIAEAKKAFRWAHPSELRLVAAQAMQKIDPEWVRNFVPRSGLSTAEFSIEPLDPDPNSSAIRQRRYPRLRLEYPVSASTTGLKENCQIEIPELTLGGGVAVCEQSLHPGSLVGLRLSAEQKNIRAQTIVRDANTQARAFELIDIELEDRAKLRKLLVQLGNATKKATPNERNRRATRTILSNPT
ncbi:MAG TPA: hypothetical protein VMF66_20550 [Candidatus Acidoferrum sp.]|nr:hypothetical protein [Candidatus Acidoferrum sp.]